MCVLELCCEFLSVKEFSKSEEDKKNGNPSNKRGVYIVIHISIDVIKWK